jgi:hypothetical protein
VLVLVLQQLDVLQLQQLDVLQLELLQDMSSPPPSPEPSSTMTTGASMPTLPISSISKVSTSSL